jgi:uncharacterized protein YutE (UPF0331/DUF86 family)
MNFETYLNKTRTVAAEELAVLTDLVGVLNDKQSLSPIEYRAAKAALQVVIENAIGKAKRILNQADCPFVPARAHDAFDVLLNTGAISDDTYRQMRSAIGFRNAMIHDYMDFDASILLAVLQQGRYKPLIQFLNEDVVLSDVVKARIRTYQP